MLGFLLTVVSSSGSLTAAESESGEVLSAESARTQSYDSVLAFAGIFVGLLGVITATVGPLTTFVRVTKQK